MPKDKYSATWVSHSSIADFLACPRAYYLKNVWKRPETKHKVQIVEGPTFSNDLLKLTDTEWQVSLLAGYAGTDFIESLYKIKFHKIS